MGGKSATHKVVLPDLSRNAVRGGLKHIQFRMETECASASLRCRIFEPENRFPLFLKML
jgi:hypothetical protein